MPLRLMTPRSKSRNCSTALHRLIACASCGFLMIQSATPNIASGALKTMPRIKPTVRLLVKNDATMPTDKHRQADEPVANIRADKQPEVRRARARN